MFPISPWLKEGSSGQERTISLHYNNLVSILLFPGQSRNLNINNSFFSKDVKLASLVFFLFHSNVWKKHSLSCWRVWCYRSLHIFCSFLKGRENECWIEPSLWTAPPPRLAGLYRQWSIASTSAHNLKHQISPPVESTFGFVQWGSTWKEHGIKCAKVQ